ncbi:MAG: NAD(P)-binding protein, partial [Terricaulis sp.]
MLANETMTRADHVARADKAYDVVVIGSGAGGATLAQRLAQTGKSILMLERGEHLPVEPDNWSPREAFLRHKYKANERWRDRKGRYFQPNIHYWVGGNTIFYGAALYRFRKNDFEETVHHGGKVSPAWPISYDDLADYYTEAEILWNVHGKRGSDATDDAFAPPYPHPPMTHDPEIKALKGRLELQGLHPFEMPIGAERDDSNVPESKCIRCRTCGGFPCLRQAKADGQAEVPQLDEEKVRREAGQPEHRAHGVSPGTEPAESGDEKSAGRNRTRPAEDARLQERIGVDDPAVAVVDQPGNRHGQH